MTECIFCKIVSNEVKAEKVYEDEEVLAFLDIKPVNPGHTLVIAKKHFRNTLETPDNILSSIVSVSKKIGNALKKAVNCEGISMLVSNEEAAGQTVFHTHFHIVPRYSNDGLKLWPQRDYEEGQSKEMADSLRKALKE